MDEILGLEEVRNIKSFRLEELTVIDIKFLHDCSTPTLILVHEVGSEF